MTVNNMWNAFATYWLMQTLLSVTCITVLKSLNCVVFVPESTRSNTIKWYFLTILSILLLCFETKSLASRSYYSHET